MRQGQTTLEYVYLIGIIAAVLIIMLAYVSRGFQGRLRVQAGSLGEQYSPKNMDTNITQETAVSFKDTTDGKFSTSKRDTVMTNKGHENIEE